MLRATRRALVTAVSVAEPNAVPSKPAGKYDFRVEREADTTSDLGARNEAAYFHYKAFEPKGIERKYALPSLNNLLTSVVVEMAFIFGFSAFTGMLAWSYYCNQRFETVKIERKQ